MPTLRRYYDERAKQGRMQKVRPLTTAERENLQRLDRLRKEAALAYDRELVHLYLIGCSQTEIAKAIGVSKENIGHMIARRRKWLGEERIPRRQPGLRAVSGG